MTQTIKQQTATKEIDPWLDGANLDLAGFPHLVPQSESEPDFLDTKFGSTLAEGMSEGLRTSLVRFVNENSNDPQIAKLLKEAGLKDESQSSKVICCGKEILILQKGNTWFAQVELEGVTTQFSALNRDSLLSIVAREVSKRSGPTFKPLSADDSLYVINLCHMGRLSDAIQNYLFFRIGDTENDVSSDARFLPVFNEAAIFVFENATPDFTEEARPYMDKFLENRKVLSLPLLRAAFESWKKSIDAEKYSHLLAGPTVEAEKSAEEIGEEIDNLPDEEVSRLFRDVNFERARHNRSGH